MSEAPKKRGRPPRQPLTPEEIEERRIAQNRSAAERRRKNGYAAQKKYKSTHPEKYHLNYEPKVRIPLEFKTTIESLTKKTGLSITQLFISAVEEKYGVLLHYNIDNRN